MSLIVYAETPAQRTRQLVRDVAVLVWVALWVRAGLWLHEQVLRLQAPGRSLQDAGDGLAGSLGDAGRRIDDVPLAGGALAAPLEAAYRSGDPALVTALANLELRALGLTAQPPAPGRAGQGASTGRKAE